MQGENKENEQGIPLEEIHTEQPRDPESIFPPLECIRLLINLQVLKWM